MLTRALPGVFACPVPGCSGERLAWQAMCTVCFKRLPRDLVAAIGRARAAKAPHLRAKAEMAAVDWLAAHPIVAVTERVLGEARGPSG